MKERIIYIILFILLVQFAAINIAYFALHKQPPLFSVYQSFVLMFLVLLLNQKK